MKHLFETEKGCTYLHSIYGTLFKMNEPIETMIEFVESNKWLVQYMDDMNWNLIPVSMDFIDLIFDWKTIWHNYYNEDFYNQSATLKC